MGVDGVDFLARGVAHEGLPHVLHDARFHEPGVEGVAKIVKAEVADARPSDRRLPGGFDPVDRMAFEREYQSFRFMAGGEERRESRGERDLAGLPACGFRVGDEKHAAIEVDVLPPLA